MVRAAQKLTWAIVGRLLMWALAGGLLLRCCRWPCPPTGLVGCRRLTVLLSTLLTRDLGRLRCCLWGALVSLPAAAGSWSLFLSLMLSPSLIAHLLPRLIPTPPPQETTSALRTPFQSNLSFISTVKTCSTRCRLPTGCFKQVCSSRFGYRQQVAKRTRMGLWSAKSALSWAVVMTTGGREVILSCRLGGSDRRNHCLLLVYSWGRPGAAAAPAPPPAVS